jgi:hypothetical protein
MADRHCLNCESATPETARFCPTCGQRTDTARLSFAEMARDLLHSFVNVERGPLFFAWALLTRPGGIAREYVEGRRRRYYGPFATLAVLVGLTALVINVSGFQVLSQEVSTARAALLQQHFNLVLLVQLPLMGIASALLFRDARLTLPEHMVLVAYTLGMRAVVLTVIVPIALLSSTSVATFWQYSAFWAAWYVYFGWAASQFYAGARWYSWLRGMLVAAIAHALIVGLLVAGSAAYEVMTRGRSTGSAMSVASSIGRERCEPPISRR